MNFLNSIKFLLFLICYAKTINSTKVATTKSFSHRLGIAFGNCLASEKTIICFEKYLHSELESMVKDNETWHFNDIISIERNPVNNSINLIHSARKLSPSYTLKDAILNQLLQIAQSRSINFQLPKMLTLLPPITSGISNVLDNFILNNAVNIDEENNTLKQYKNKELCSYKTSLKGRKKKDKDKNIMMMGGMTILAMLAQMFLGKVILIAGAAFVMAKIALISSFLGSIKKGISHSSIPIPIATSEHVYHTTHDVGGHHSHQDVSGWQRQGI